VAEVLAEVDAAGLEGDLPVDLAVNASVQIVAIGNHISLVYLVTIKNVLNVMHLWQEHRK
jgi:hypothetical protein